MSTWDPKIAPTSSTTSASNSINYGAPSIGNHQKVNSTLPPPPVGGPPFIPGLSTPFGSQPPPAHGPTPTPTTTSAAPVSVSAPAPPAPIEYHSPSVQAPLYTPPVVVPQPHHQLPPGPPAPHIHPHPHPQPSYMPPYLNNHGHGPHGQPPHASHVPPHGTIPPPSQYPLRLPSNSPISPGSHHTPLTPGGSHVIPSVPHTPQGAPLVNPFANGPETDLHPQLLEIGWRKFWSKRENRWYFWNCNTGESLWEVPPLPRPGPYDPLTDPLGIQSAGVAGHHQMNPALKRRVSSGEHMGSPPVKKFILMGPWDLEVLSNVYSSEASLPRPNLLPPHPETEQLRSQLVAKLRQCYQQSCKSREGIDAPKDSLNRWIMERKVFEKKSIDPVFPASASSADEETEDPISSVMFREIMNDVPMKVIKPRFTADARKQLAKYADACKRTVETRSTSAEARKLVKWKVEETFSWLKNTVGAPYDALQERMAHLKDTCQSHVHDAAKQSVEGICRKMSSLSKQYAQQVHTAHMKLFVDPQNVKTEYEPDKGKFRCQPALCGTYQFIQSHVNPQIDFQQPDRDHAILKYKNDAVRITTQYLQKLEQVYRYNCVDDRKFEFFLARSYILLKRYNAYCEDYVHPHSSQSSLPVPVFEAIQRNFGVTFECFSSPLNCYFRQYCSAFPDIDGYFGSRGTFFNFHPVAGSFEMNPPFSEELIDASITHVEELLAASQDSMSFMIFVPDFSESKDNGDIDCPWLKRLENSRWTRKQITIPAYEHDFRHGAQHIVPKSEVSVRSSHATVIFWLQNDNGFEEWKPTEQKIDALIEAYKPGRERERDRQDLLSPERQNPHIADKQVAAVAAGCVIPILPT